jgi:hypothetical protein
MIAAVAVASARHYQPAESAGALAEGGKAGFVRRDGDESAIGLLVRPAPALRGNST